MNKRQLIFSMFGLLIFLVIIMLPGMVSVNVMAHEFYHVMNHRSIAKSACVDINSFPYVAHVNVVFPDDDSMRAYLEMQSNGEERAAVRFGQLASFVYVVLSAFLLFWVGWIVSVHVKPERVRRHVVRHIRKLHKRIRKMRKK